MTNYNLKYFLKSIHLPQYTINCKSEKNECFCREKGYIKRSVKKT